MTLEDIKKNKSTIACFWCGSILGNYPTAKFVAIFSDEGVISIINARTGNKDPMVFCSSDCMVYDSHLRYQDRIARGVFRKHFNNHYKDSHQLPSRWAEEQGKEVIK